MLVKDLMSTKLLTVSPQATVRACAHKLEQLNIGALPVVEKGDLVGFITDRDICCRVVGMGRNPETTTVKDVMTSDVLFCYEDQSYQQAAESMKTARLRRLPVVTRDHRLVGLISIDDLARYSHEVAGKVLDVSSSLCGDPTSANGVLDPGQAS